MPEILNRRSARLDGISVAEVGEHPNNLSRAQDSIRIDICIDFDSIPLVHPHRSTASNILLEKIGTIYDSSPLQLSRTPPVLKKTDEAEAQVKTDFVGWKFMERR
jgi:hypothetical protein